MTYEFILTEVRGRVGLARLNRPKARNALNKALLQELMAALKAFDADSEIGAMVVAGDERAFAAGADIKEMADATVVEMLQGTSSGTSTPSGIFTSRSSRRFRAGAWAGGNELAMSCDMIVASETARFGQPEINLGVIPGAGGTQRLAACGGQSHRLGDGAQ